METAYIYTLSDPRTNEVRYVGKTNNPEKRRKAHGVLSREIKSKKKNWVKQLKKLNLRPVFEIIDEVPQSEWQKWERYWIQQFIVWGFKLTNHTAGGDGLTIGNQTSFKCGQAPWNKGLKSKKHCVICNKEFGVSPSKYETTKCCSKSCNMKLKVKTGVVGETYKNGHIPWNKGNSGHRLVGMKMAIPVLQYDVNMNLIKEHYSVLEASKLMNCIPENIRRACVGKSKTAKGFIWKYKNTINDN